MIDLSSCLRMKFKMELKYESYIEESKKQNKNLLFHFTQLIRKMCSQNDVSSCPNSFESQICVCRRINIHIHVLSSQLIFNEIDKKNVFAYARNSVVLLPLLVFHDSL